MEHFCVDYFHGCYDFRSFCLFAIIDTSPIILMPSKQKEKQYGKGESYWIRIALNIEIRRLSFGANLNLQLRFLGSVCICAGVCVCLIAIECFRNKRITKPNWIDIVYCTVFIIVSLPCSYTFIYSYVSYIKLDSKRFLQTENSALILISYLRYVMFGYSRTVVHFATAPVPAYIDQLKWKNLTKCVQGTRSDAKRTWIWKWKWWWVFGTHSHLCNRNRFIDGAED